jgi:hypothetical protein
VGEITCPVETQTRQRPHGPIHGDYVPLQRVQQVEAGDFTIAQQANHFDGGHGDQAPLNSLRLGGMDRQTLRGA